MSHKLTFFCVFSGEYKDLSSARLENVTQTISRMLQGYDIRLRPNFGGEKRAFYTFNSFCFA